MRGMHVGRYQLSHEIASGGMATVHLGRLLGKAGFARIVAIKRLHPNLVKDAEFRRSFVDEARIASRIRHPKVAATLDVEEVNDELFLVLEYVHGETLSRLATSARVAVPPRIAVRIVIDALEGLHAAHEATDALGKPLALVHRDVSPQNILVGVDGVARVLDFGVAHAVNRLQTTTDGAVKGKLAYMAPEQILGEPVDRRTDVFAAGIVLWEALVGRRLFKADQDAKVIFSILKEDPADPSTLVPTVSGALGGVVLKALAKSPDERFATAQDMASALEEALPPAPPAEVGAWVRSLAQASLERKQELIASVEREPAPSEPQISVGPAPRPVVAATVPMPFRPVAQPAAVEAHRPPEPEPSGTSRGLMMPAAPRERSSRTLLAGAAVLLVLGGAGAAVVATRIGAATSAPVAAATGLPSSAAVPAETPASAQPEPSAPVPAPPDTGLAPPPASTTTPAVSDKSSATAPRTSPPSTARPRAVPPPASASSPSPPAVTDDCANPFTVDAQGIRHPKLHCLSR